jgi:1,4-dihydroxy-2-naphthoate octaprenyltransferase
MRLWLVLAVVATAFVAGAGWHFYWVGQLVSALANIYPFTGGPVNYWQLGLDSAQAGLFWAVLTALTLLALDWIFGFRRHHV